MRNPRLHQEEVLQEVSIATVLVIKYVGVTRNRGKIRVSAPIAILPPARRSVLEKRSVWEILLWPKRLQTLVGTETAMYAA